MEYFLGLITFGDHPTLPIDSERFILLKTSKQILAEALVIEEEYEMIISNYIDLERESINASLIYMVRDTHTYIDFFDTRLALNRRLMSLLTSVTLYTDTLESHCEVCLPKESGIKELVKKISSTEYDKNVDYRFMENLRNYIQHKNTAVHNVSYGGRWTALDDNGLLEYSSSFMADKSVLASDKKFKKHILNEMPDKINLMVSTRSYIESISKIHDNVRKMVSKNVNESRTIIQTAIDDYKIVYKDNFAGLSAFEFDGHKKTDETPIFLSWDDIRIELEKRNKNLVNLKKRYVTGQVEKK